MRIFLCRSIAGFLLLGAARARAQAVSIDHESKHHRVLANDYVRVYDVIVPAGDSTRYHVHPNDYVYVTFGAVALKAQAMGAAQTDLALANGEVRFTAAPITHRVLNPSATPFHNLTIEVMKPAGTGVSPTGGGEVVLENAKVRVERIVLDPGRSTKRHEHLGPWLDVGISSGLLGVTDANGNVRRIEYAPASYHWNATRRTHTLTNVGTTRLEIVEIEWK